MASILNASLSSGLVATGDTSGIIQLQSNGSALATFAPTGITAGIVPFPSLNLLGTLTTTSGVTQTLSGLTLTNYKQLQLVLKNVSWTAAAYLVVNGTSIALTPTTSGAGYAQWGMVIVDLSTSVFLGWAVENTTGSTNFSNNSNTIQGGIVPWTTSTTSISFSGNTGSFDAGSITVYGVA